MVGDAVAARGSNALRIAVCVADRSDVLRSLSLCAFWCTKCYRLVLVGPYRTGTGTGTGTVWSRYTGSLLASVSLPRPSSPSQSPAFVLHHAAVIASCSWKQRYLSTKAQNARTPPHRIKKYQKPQRSIKGFPLLVT